MNMPSAGSISKIEDIPEIEAMRRSPAIPESARENLIDISHVSMVYRNSVKEEITALKDVSLGIRPGEFVSLLGPSGCGKTTLLRIIADLLEPSQGSVTIAGSSPRQNRLEKKYGMVFQSPVLFEWRSVLKNVCLPLEIMKVPKNERMDRARAQLAMVGLGDFCDSYPFQLSGGMQQRVGIARALVTNPELLLMDEPFSALDEFTREKLNEDLLDIWQRTHKTIVFVTHNISEAVFLSDRVFVLSPHPGRLSSVIDIDLPRPRTRECREYADFSSLVARIRRSFEGVYKLS